MEEEGERLREEFHRPEGPRGRRASAPIDTEIEERLRAKLQALVSCTFAGEETGTSPGLPQEGGEKWTWLVDPQDGTSEFLAGRRGSCIAVALLRGSDAVLGVVHSPLSPDRGSDTIAWAEGSPLQRNGQPIEVDLSRRSLAPGEIGWANAGSASRPETYTRAFLPARYVAMPSIAYRLARVAAGDGVATVSVHEVKEYDIAAGLALIRAAGGVALDRQGRDIVLTGNPEGRLSGCFAGAPQAARKLALFDWSALEGEPRRPPRINLGFPRNSDPLGLSRAHGCLLGQVIGDSLDAGRRGLHTLPGQPTDDSEMALVLARFLVFHKDYLHGKVLDTYRDWLTTRPVEVGEATERGLLGLHTAESQSSGSLMRVSPIGVWARGDPGRAARAAREDSALTHPHPACVEACAGYCAAIAAGIAGASRDQMLAAALAHASGPAREAIGAAVKPGEEVLVDLQNAFFHLRHSSFEDSVAQSLEAGANAAIAGALLGAAHGREAIPSRWILTVLACRPLAEAAPRPRPYALWPDDVLEIAEALLKS